MRAEFDAFAGTYEALHDQNVALVGAESQEFLHDKLRWCSRFAARLLPARAGVRRTLLDYGCGVGRFGLEFDSYFDGTWDYLGVDAAPACIETAQQQYRSMVRASGEGGDRIQFQATESWNGAALSCDLTFLACVLHHVEPADRGALLARLWSALRPGGAIVVWEHNPWNPLTRRLVRECAFDQNACLLSVPEMSRLWRQSIGKGDTDYRFVTFFPGALRRLKPMDRALGWLPLGGQWVFWACKAPEATG